MCIFYLDKIHIRCMSVPTGNFHSLVMAELGLNPHFPPS